MAEGLAFTECGDDPGGGVCGPGQPAAGLSRGRVCADGGGGADVCEDQVGTLGQGGAEDRRAVESENEFGDVKLDG